MRVRKLVRRFLAHTEEHRKPATLRHYAGRLKAFVARLGDRKLKTLKLEEIEEYLHEAGRFPDGRLKAQDTRRANVTVLQQLFRFAQRRDLVDLPKCDALERPPSRRRDRIPTDDENAAVEAIAKPEFVLIFRALRQSGARPGELARACIADYDEAARLIVLADHKTATKVGRPRKIGVGDKLQLLIREAIGERTDGPIFLDGKGEAWTSEKLSRAYLYWRKKAGLPDGLCLYLQRHQHATELCEKAGIFVAAQSLGHASTKTTERYLHPDDSALSKNQDLV